MGSAVGLHTQLGGPLIKWATLNYQGYVCSHFSPVWFLVTPCTAARQAPLSMGFSKHECWSGLPCPPPEDLPGPGIKPMFLTSPAVAGGFFTTSATIVKAKSLSRVRLFVTPWTVAYQASQSMEFSRQEYWSGLPFPSPGDLPNPGIEPMSLMTPALTGGFFTTSATWS